MYTTFRISCGTLQHVITIRAIFTAKWYKHMPDYQLSHRSEHCNVSRHCAMLYVCSLHTGEQRNYQNGEECCFRCAELCKPKSGGHFEQQSEERN